MKIAFGIAAALVLAGAGTAAAAPFALTSTAFKNNGTIDQKNAGNIMGCTGEGKSPALEWKNPPAGTKSFVLMMHDPDAPTGGSGSASAGTRPDTGGRRFLERLLGGSAAVEPARLPAETRAEPPAPAHAPAPIASA